MKDLSKIFKRLESSIIIEEGNGKHRGPNKAET